MFGSVVTLHQMNWYVFFLNMAKQELDNTYKNYDSFNRSGNTRNRNQQFHYKAMHYSTYTFSYLGFWTPITLHKSQQQLLGLFCGNERSNAAMFLRLQIAWSRI